MAKKQSRRSVSVRGDTYRRLREHCVSSSISDYIEELVAKDLGVERPAPRPKVALEERVRAAEADTDAAVEHLARERDTPPPERRAPTRKMAIAVKPAPRARPIDDVRGGKYATPTTTTRPPAIPDGVDDPARSGRAPVRLDASKAPARAIPDPWSTP